MRPGEGKRKGENVAVAQCPASCGELIQGWILGSEKLVSCPVDWYSTVEVETGVPRKDERPLSRAMVDQLLAHWGYPPALSQQIRITLHSTIPVAKGMASSTADIAATAVATAHHLGHPLDEPTLARLCVALEPTDSTLFRQLTLFDHNTAATQRAANPVPSPSSPTSRTLWVMRRPPSISRTLVFNSELPSRRSISITFPFLLFLCVYANPCLTAKGSPTRGAGERQRD